MCEWVQLVHGQRATAFLCKNIQTHASSEDHTEAIWKLLIKPISNKQTFMSSIWLARLVPYNCTAVSWPEQMTVACWTVFMYHIAKQFYAETNHLHTGPYPTALFQVEGSAYSTSQASYLYWVFRNTIFLENSPLTFRSAAYRWTEESFSVFCPSQISLLLSWFSWRSISIVCSHS